MQYINLYTQVVIRKYILQILELKRSVPLNLLTWQKGLETYGEYI